MLENTVTENKEIENSYNKAANSYDKHSISQRKIADKLFSYLPQTANNVLDLGCGTGYLSKKISTRYKNITLVDNSRKMLEQAHEKVPHAKTALLDFNKDELLFKDTYDLILSSSALHWANDFEATLVKIKKIAQKGLIFSIMLDGTLKEIREIRKEVAPNKRIKPILHSHNYYLDILKLHGFKIKHSEQMQVVINFKTVDHSIRHLRKTGVNAGSDKLDKRELFKLMSIYERRYNNPVPMTFRAGMYVAEI